MERGAFRIGEVADRARVNVQTLRFYERRGLLPEPPRQPSGYRQYSLDSVRRVQFIKGAQRLGFTLTQVGELLALRDSSRLPCPQVRSTAERKVTEIEEKIRQLDAMKSALQVLVASCEANRDHECPLLEALERTSGERRPIERTRSS